MTSYMKHHIFQYAFNTSKNLNQIQDRQISIAEFFLYNCLFMFQYFVFVERSAPIGKIDAFTYGIL